MDYEAEIEAIEAHEIAGNFHQDRELWARCDRLILDGNAPLEVRLRALKRVDQIVGDVQETYTYKDLYAHVRELRRMMGS